MELRDYLMPGEYILTVFTNLDISPGNFNGLAVTNERIILFSTKSGVGKLFRKNRSEDIKNLKSVFFKNTPMIEMRVYEGSLGNLKIISLDKYIRIIRYDGSLWYGVDSSIGIIKSKLGGPQLSEIKEALEQTLRSLAPRTEIHYSEKEKAWVFKFMFKPLQDQ